MSDATCGDCAVKPGEPHKGGCDVARCLMTGGQRLGCEGPKDEFGFPRYTQITHDDGSKAVVPHDCGWDVWTGEWPGDAECREFGWWVQDRCAEGMGFVRCALDAPGAREDLNRLVGSGEAVWSVDRRRWVLR